jgi:hypothetical protein
MNLRRSFALGLALSAASCSAPPREREAVGHTSQAIYEGTIVQEPSAEILAQVISTGPFGCEGAQCGCTGTLILPDWLLTAAHCVLGLESTPSAVTASFFGDESVYQADRISSWFEWGNPGNAGCDPNGSCIDVAVIHLASTVWHQLTQHPPFWEQHLDSGPAFPGATLSCYGWGHATPDPNEDLRLREGLFDVTRDFSYGYEVASHNGFMFAGGDSGGPCFTETFLGVAPPLTGIHSGVSPSAAYEQQAMDPAIVNWVLHQIAAPSPAPGVNSTDWPGAYGDVNADGVPDFCRFRTPDGSAAVKVTCQLGMWNGLHYGWTYFRPDPDEYGSWPQFTPGAPGSQSLADINGDARADFCQRKDIYYTVCNLAGAHRFGEDLTTGDDSHTGADGALVQIPGDDAIYLVDRGVRRHVPNADTFNRLFRSWVFSVGADWSSLAAGLPIASDAYLARSANAPEVYFVEYGQKRHVMNAAVMDRYNFDWGKIQVVSDATIAALKLGDPLP